MSIKFAKYEGLGNDFIVIDYTTENTLEILISSDISKKLCDRHFGKYFQDVFPSISLKS